MILMEEDSGMLTISNVTDTSLLLQSGSGRVYRFDLESWEVFSNPD